MKREYQQGKDHPSRNRVQRIAVSCMLSCMALLYAGKSAAKPDMKPLGPNIADRGSAVYHFSVHQFDSADGKRLYRVWTGVPDTSPPPSGYPVLYMLDGNALMDRLSDELLKQLTQKNAAGDCGDWLPDAAAFRHPRQSLRLYACGAAGGRGRCCRPLYARGRRQRDVPPAAGRAHRPDGRKKILTSTPINEASGDTPSAGCSYWTAG